MKRVPVSFVRVPWARHSRVPQPAFFLSAASRNLDQRPTADMVQSLKGRPHFFEPILTRN